jgi:hypothetical protein
MAMRKITFRAVVLAWLEEHFYMVTQGLGASFSLTGGQYDIYVYAKRTVVGACVPESRSDSFGGNFQRV